MLSNKVLNKPLYPLTKKPRVFLKEFKLSVFSKDICFVPPFRGVSSVKVMLITLRNVQVTLDNMFRIALRY